MSRKMSTEESSSTSSNFNASHLALSSAFRRRVRPVLNRIDMMRTVGLQSKLKLPMVAVVGDQSVGKSSVLEAISGIELPRGTGIVTRCPLQLAMRCVEGGSWSGSISYKTLNNEQVSKTLQHPQEVDEAVREAQSKMTKGDGDISEEQINLAIESDNVPDLTLLDLPGIARYSSTSGTGIAATTKSLISKYIEQPQVLILVVVPCHVDIETVEALSLAKNADPNGERTIGVMTCPDMVNRGAESDVIQIALNRKITLRKGYIMVKCRDPQELKDHVTLADSLTREVEFFKNHEHFSKLPRESVGVANLAERLTTELFESIRRNIPKLLSEIKDLIRSHQQELASYGDAAPETKADKIQLLNRMINQFSAYLSVAARGELSAEYRLFSRLRKHWEQLANEIEAAKPTWVTRLSISHDWTPPSSVSQHVTELRGRELLSYDYIFPIVEKIYREEFLSKLKEPAIDFLEKSKCEILDTIKAVAETALKGYDELFQVLIENSSEEVDLVEEEARRDLDRLFRQESRLFTQDSIFQLRMNKIEENLQKDCKLTPEIKEKVKAQDSIERIRRAVEAYLQVASERLEDIIPQSVLYFMLDVVAERVTKRVGQMTSEAESYIDMLEDDPFVIQRRRILSEQLAQLQQALREFGAFRAASKTNV